MEPKGFSYHWMLTVGSENKQVNKLLEKIEKKKIDVPFDAGIARIMMLMFIHDFKEKDVLTLWKSYIQFMSLETSMPEYLKRYKTKFMEKNNDRNSKHNTRKQGLSSRNGRRLHKTLAHGT